MIREDSSVQSSFMMLLFGLIIVVMVTGFTLTQQPPRGFTNTGYVMLSFGIVLLISGAYLLRRHIQSLSQRYSTGQEVRGKVTDCRIGGGSRSGTRTILEVAYSYHGRSVRSETTIPYAVPIAAGTEVVIVVDPDDPERFFLRDSYETKRGAIESSTDICSVCQEQIPFLEVDSHMKLAHPKEYITWRLWMVALIASIVVPIGAMILSVVVFYDERVIYVVAIAIFAIVLSQIVIERMGKRWEAKVNKSWRSSHPGRAATMRKDRES